MKFTNFDFLGIKKYTLGVSAVLMGLIIVCALVFGVLLDVQFSGGTIVTYTYTGTVSEDTVKETAESVIGKDVSVNMKKGVNNLDSFEIVMNEKEGISADTQSKLTDEVTKAFADNDVQLLSNSTVDPIIGMEFFAKSLVAIALAAVLIVIYVAFRFKRISGWSAGVMALVALLHDAIVAFGVFVIFRIPLDFNFVAVILTILGYSINDTIIIYDRMRENQRLYSDLSRTVLVNRSIGETLSRTINTTLTTIAAVAVICVVAVVCHVESILSFSFPLLIGMISGTYSTIFVACPLWTIWQDHKAKRQPKRKAVTSTR